MTAFWAHSQTRELLQPLNRGQAERLEAYNRVALQEDLYSAARPRIVSVNTDLLMQNEAFTITPFEDVKPIVVEPERVTRTDDYVQWMARIQPDPSLETRGAKFLAPITVTWFDVDDAGNAQPTGRNRFKFFPRGASTKTTNQCVHLRELPVTLVRRRKLQRRSRSTNACPNFKGARLVPWSRGWNCLPAKRTCSLH